MCIPKNKSILRIYIASVGILAQNIHKSVLKPFRPERRKVEWTGFWFMKDNNLNYKNEFYCPSHWGDNPDCNYIMTLSENNNVNHGFIAIFFLVNSFVNF